MNDSADITLEDIDQWIEIAPDNIHFGKWSPYKYRTIKKVDYDDKPVVTNLSNRLYECRWWVLHCNYGVHKEAARDRVASMMGGNT